MVVVCGKEVTGTMNTEISMADRLHIICTTLDGLVPVSYTHLDVYKRQGTDGKAVSDYFDSALKTVYVKEITAPTGYKLNTEVYKVDVAAGKTLTVTATDERVTGRVKIAKIDKETLAFKAQGDSVLRGAVYGLYAKEDIVHPDGITGVLYKQDSLIAQGVIGDDGTLEFSELYLGEMYVKEITPPEGYTLDTTKYEVSVTYEGQDVAEVTRDLTVKEQVKKQAFQLIKISEDGEQTETDLVAGAGFQVYLISDLSQVKNGKLKPANGESYTANDFKNYDFSKEQVAVTYENGTTVPVPELITDTKGYAVSPELPYGSYVVVESTTPENLKTIDPFVVNVENDSREPMQWRLFDERPFEFLLKIVKKDAQTGNTVLKAGASYKSYDVTNKKYVEPVSYTHLFSGIGGFREGLRRAGNFVCVGHCEVDTYADKNYRLLFDTEGEWYCSCLLYTSRCV